MSTLYSVGTGLDTLSCYDWFPVYQRLQKQSLAKINYAWRQSVNILKVWSMISMTNKFRPIFIILFEVLYS